MVEGESGLLAIGPVNERPEYTPSKRRLTWRNGAIATTGPSIFGTMQNQQPTGQPREAA